MTHFRHAALVLAATIAVPQPATAAVYQLNGSFKTQGGSSYARLSGGGFTGRFEVNAAIYPLAANTSHYLYDVPFYIDIFDRAGTFVSRLQNTPSRDTYLQVASSYADIYKGLRLFFRISNGDYLQVVMPLDFRGTGATKPDGLSYALVGGTAYATVSDARISLAPVPEAPAWTMLIAGFGGLGATFRNRRRGPRAVTA